MTKIQYELLKPFENRFSTAINQQYISGIQKRDFDIVLNTYRQITGDRYNYTISCNSCIMQLFVKCGSLYFGYKPEVIVEEKTENKKDGRKIK